MSSAQDLAVEHHPVVENFVSCFKSNDIEKLKTLVSYPISRQYPIPDITNEEEFVSRYHEVFDDTLIQEIITSDIANDWSAVGWRGIMLNHGSLWLDYDGNLIGVNYQSSLEQEMREALIIADKKVLHDKLKKYQEPTLVLETPKFRVRIDLLENGSYRYASWPINSSMSDKPDIILTNGHVIIEGSGGNHRYEFINGKYKYECSIIRMGENDSPPAELIVYKREKELLRQRAELIR